MASKNLRIQRAIVEGLTEGRAALAESGFTKQYDIDTQLSVSIRESLERNGLRIQNAPKSKADKLVDIL